MRLKIIILITILLSVSSRTFAQSSFEINAQFTQISLHGPFKVELIPAESSSAVVTLYGVDQNRVKWSAKNGKLNLSLQVGLLDKNSFADVKIYYTELSYIGVEGITMKNSEPLVGTELTLATIGSINKVQLSVNLAELNVTATGKSEIVLRGSSQNADIKAYIGARIDCMQCEIEDVVATANQGSEIYIKTSGRLDAKVSTMGNLYYIGSPKLRAKATLGGAVISIEPHAIPEDGNSKSETDQDDQNEEEQE